MKFVMIRNFFREDFQNRRDYKIKFYSIESFSQFLILQDENKNEMK